MRESFPMRCGVGLALIWVGYAPSPSTCKDFCPMASASTYHHGDLRAALLAAADEMLEAGAPLSLRALARSAGVSQAAPYRHFADKEALESALAVRGLRDLFEDLTADKSPPASAEDIAELGVGYVRFALRRPALFKLMFGQECDDQDDERVVAAAALHEYLSDVTGQVFTGVDADDLATAGWGLAHGLAFLHLDGKLSSDDPRLVDERVRAAFAAVLPNANHTRRQENS